MDLVRRKKEGSLSPHRWAGGSGILEAKGGRNKEE